MQRAKYYDELELGERFVTMSRTVTETDLVNWLTLTGVHEEMFMSREVARDKTIFARPIVPAPLTQALASGLFGATGILHNRTVAFLGQQMRAIAPLFLGDTIHSEVEVTVKKPTSKPDRGVITLLHTVNNQHDQPVISFTTTFMMWRHPDLIAAEQQGE